MTYPQVQTTQPGMQQAAQVFADTTTQFNAELQRVNSMMADLQVSWTGDASAAFNGAMDTWEITFKGIIDQLINMMGIMGVNKDQYERAELDAVETAGSFYNALPNV